MNRRTKVKKLCRNFPKKEKDLQTTVVGPKHILYKKGGHAVIINREY